MAQATPNCSSHLAPCSAPELANPPASCRSWTWSLQRAALWPAACRDAPSMPAARPRTARTRAANAPPPAPVSRAPCACWLLVLSAASWKESPPAESSAPPVLPETPHATDFQPLVDLAEGNPAVLNCDPSSGACTTDIKGVAFWAIDASLCMQRAWCHVACAGRMRCRSCPCGSCTRGRRQPSGTTRGSMQLAFGCHP